MRVTIIFVIFAAAGCFSPIVADGGFACDPDAVSPCPTGYYCRNRSNQYVCTRSPTPTPPVTSDGDMAMSGTGGGGGGTGGGGDMAGLTGGGDMAVPANCGVANLLINEVLTRGASASDEWIEFYNPCAQDITFSGTVVYRGPTSMTDSTVFATLSNKVFPKQGYFLVANNGYSGTADFKPFAAGGMGDDGGGVALRDGSMNIITSMAWGSATDNKFQQGNPAPANTATSSIARTPNGANSKNDVNDFKLASTPTPRGAN
jgi:hypothetical protein